MRLFSKTIVKYPKTAATVFLLTFSSLLFAFYWFEPFSPKYRGKSVDSWLTYCAKNNRPVPDDVIMAFGPDAMPALERAIDTLTSTGRRLKNHPGIFEIVNKTFFMYGRGRKAREWGKSLYLDFSTSKMEMLSAMRSPELMRAVLAGEAPRELKVYASQKTNSMLKTNAELILQMREMMRGSNHRPSLSTP